jgi:hypothetical protein
MAAAASAKKALLSSEPLQPAAGDVGLGVGTGVGVAVGPGDGVVAGAADGAGVTLMTMGVIAGAGVM